MFDVRPSALEHAAAVPGDDIVPQPDVVMDRAFTLAALPEAVWPWLVQLGKHRAGWYLPRGVELVVPPGRRSLRFIDPALQSLAVGDVIPDWGGANATFEVARLDPPSTLVYRTQRGRTNLSWAIVLSPAPDASTRVHLRLRMAPVRRRRLAEVGGGLLDWLTIVGLAAGLRERVTPSAAGWPSR
jgi:hypothetical protein